MFLFFLFFQTNSVKESNARQTGYQLHINPSGSPKGILQRHPHSSSPPPPYPPPTPAISSLTKSHFLCPSNRYWLKITRTSRQVVISPQEYIQDPCMTCEEPLNLKTTRRLLSTLCGWSTPPLMCSDERFTVPLWTPRRRELTITEKSHYQRAMKEVN